MTNKTTLTEYNGIAVGQITIEYMKRGTKQKLCRGIYFDDEANQYLAGYQYIDRKATRQNKKVTVSGKSPFWFEKI